MIERIDSVDGWMIGTVHWLTRKLQGYPVVMQKNTLSQLRHASKQRITTMLIAAVLVTIGYSRQKRAVDATDKHRTAAIFYGLGLLLILLAIHWPFRVEGAGWF